MAALEKTLQCILDHLLLESSSWGNNCNLGQQEFGSALTLLVAQTIRLLRLTTMEKHGVI